MATNKGPFDPEDTDWGQKYERRHNDYTRRFDTIDTRIDSITRKQSEIDRDLSLNTQVTQEIKKDTAALVALFNGSKVLGAIIKWVVAVAVGIAGAWAWVKGIR